MRLSIDMHMQEVDDDLLAVQVGFWRVRERCFDAQVAQRDRE